MNRNEYTEEQKAEFLDYAKEHGIAKSIRDLGYPTFPTAKTWAKQYGVDLPLNQLSQFANNMKQYYSHEEKLYAAQLLMDRITERMNSIDDLDGDELKKLSEALKRAAETMNLIEGKATSITQSHNDPFDNDMQAMIEEQERINKAKELNN